LACARTQVSFDPSHGGTNDIKLVIKHCGLWNHQLLATAAAHAPFSPFGTGQRRCQVSESMAEYFHLFSPANCPIFQSLIPSLLEERGESHRHTEEGNQPLKNSYISFHYMHPNCINITNKPTKSRRT
jgi:hypothetical protein